MTTKRIVRQLSYKYKCGYSLKRIYDDLADTLGHPNSPWVFLSFLIANKNNEDFMKEFNATCFVENINPPPL